MNCRMPEMDGYETTRAVRALGDNTPIIGLTSHPSSGAKEEGLDCVMNAFMEKPLATYKLEESNNC